MVQSTGTARKSSFFQNRRTRELNTGRSTFGRIAAASATALLLAAEVARLTAAKAEADKNPSLASFLAPRAPDALVQSSMAEVGEAAAKGIAVSAATRERLRLVAGIAPLRPEPYLVQAALESRARSYARAEKLLLDARWRDPRSPAARYLLADVWFREDKVAEALGEMAVLSRLIPGSAVGLAPALAEYARMPNAREQLAPVLARNPQLKVPLLTALAADPANADLVLALAGDDARSSDPEMRVWQTRLLNGFLSQGKYGQAYSLWRKMVADPIQGQPLLFNGNFRQLAAPPPFNWEFYSGPAGVTEAKGGRLRIMFYGRESAIFASQTLLLPAGRYRLRAPLSGSAPRRALLWALTCLPGSEELVSIDATLGTASFTVPQKCEAQSLRLVGQIEDMPIDSDVVVGPVLIERAGI